MKARHDGRCDRCNKPIHRGIHDVARIVGWLIDHHVQTANRKATR